MTLTHSQAIGKAVGAALLAQQAATLLIKLGHSDMLQTLGKDALQASHASIEATDDVDLDQAMDAAQLHINALLGAARAKALLDAAQIS